MHHAVTLINTQIERLDYPHPLTVTHLDVFHPLIFALLIAPIHTFHESFSMPELKNFLRILNREEAWYKKRIHEKYELVLLTMQKLMDEKRPNVLPLADVDNPASQSEC
jgi:hypothetical protein